MTVENRIYESTDYLSSTDEFKITFEQKTELQCKFVTLRAGNRYILIYGSLREFGYHALLVERYCEDANILATWRRKPDLYEILEKDVSILGGGWLQFDFKRGKLKAFGHSTAYGPFEPNLTAQLIQSDKLLNRFKI